VSELKSKLNLEKVEKRRLQERVRDLERKLSTQGKQEST
jgi:hypothetical protein